MPDAYLLDDKTWAAIEPLLPTVYATVFTHFTGEPVDVSIL